MLSTKKWQVLVAHPYYTSKRTKGIAIVYRFIFRYRRVLRYCPPPRKKKKKSGKTNQKKGSQREVKSGPEKGVITKGVFSVEESLESLSKISKFSKFSRSWLDSPLFSTVWGFSRISRISKFSRISRKWTFLKRPLFQKTPFSEPDRGGGWLSQLKLPFGGNRAIGANRSHGITNCCLMSH